MRPPVETPIMNKPRLRISKVPVKHAETRLISSLSNGLVPFMVWYSCRGVNARPLYLDVISRRGFIKNVLLFASEFYKKCRIIGGRYGIIG